MPGMIYPNFYREIMLLLYSGVKENCEGLLVFLYSIAKDIGKLHQPNKSA